MDLQRTANSVLTVCLSFRGKRTYCRRAQSRCGPNIERTANSKYFWANRASLIRSTAQGANVPKQTFRYHTTNVL
jgi:hypothetical protein